MKTTIARGGVLSVYNAYVSEIEKAGETPLSYEDWIKGVSGEKGENGDKGEKGDKGDKGETGDQGLSAYEIYKKTHVVYTGTEEEWINDLASGKIAESYNTTYNIIFTVATIPPVLSSLDCIANGYQTYAFIERGKTYYGIDRVDSFNNLGFNVNSNKSEGFTESDFNCVLDKIKELNVYGNEKFNIYVQDGTALYGAMLAANARLKTEQYKVIMVEDGSGAYVALSDLLTNMSSYSEFSAYISEKSKYAKEILSVSDNNFVSYYDIKQAFALASLDNFVYLLQSKGQLEAIVQSAEDIEYNKYFGLTDETALANIRYESINEKVSSLSDSQKQEYLKLMYGKAYEGTYNALTRTRNAQEESVPTKKLVFIGTRVVGYPTLATSILAKELSGTTIPQWDSLGDEYKNKFIFNTESDYNILYNILANDDYFDSTWTDDEKSEARVKCFNYYINYISVFKFIYEQYGSEYDIIIKGHPSETMESYEEWNQYQTNTGKRFSKMMFDSVSAFHNGDSVGKKIGTMPYGTAAENLAYLGVDISIGGLPSSTYSGYDKTVDVVFVLAISNDGIAKDGNLAERYQNDNLIYHDSTGKTNITKYFNTGLIYKTLSNISDEENQAGYVNKLNEWIKGRLNSDSAQGYTVNDQGYVEQIDFGI